MTTQTAHNTISGQSARPGMLALVLFTVAAGLFAAALAGGNLATTGGELAAPAAQHAIPDWRGNSASLPLAQ